MRFFKDNYVVHRITLCDRRGCASFMHLGIKRSCEFWFLSLKSVYLTLCPENWLMRSSIQVALLTKPFLSVFIIDLHKPLIKVNASSHAGVCLKSYPRRKEDSVTINKIVYNQCFNRERHQTAIATESKFTLHERSFNETWLENHILIFQMF